MKKDKRKIILAADHAGFMLKETIKKFLESKGHEVVDVGAHEYKEEDDYPVFMTAAAIKVAEDLHGETVGIIFGGSGQGEAMMANRFPGVRATVWYGGDMEVLKLSREHNDANVLSIGARFVEESEAKIAVELWLATPFTGDERHVRRITQIDNVE